MKQGLYGEELKPDDAGDVLHLWSSVLFSNPAQLNTFNETLTDLIANERALGGVLRRRSDDRVEAFGMLVFADDDVIDEQISSGWGMIALNLLSQSGQPAFLDTKQQAQANQTDGMAALLLDFCVRIDNLEGDEGNAIMQQSIPLFLRNFEGFNVTKQYWETGPRFRPFAESAGYYPVQTVKGNITSPFGSLHDQERTMFCVERQSKPVGQLDLMQAALAYQPPRFRLTPAEQRVIKAALPGRTDRQIATTLGISHDAVKQTWERIYNHIGDDLSEIPTSEGESGARGGERRRQIISYMADHINELRPYTLRRN